MIGHGFRNEKREREAIVIFYKVPTNVLNEGNIFQKPLLQLSLNGLHLVIIAAVKLH